jgi:hypothetical protein
MANPFVKGDPRINRKGRPKSFDKLRSLAVEMASEQAVDKNGEPILLHGKPVTNAQLIMYQWLTDKKYQKDFIEVAFGKVPQGVQLTGENGGAIKVDNENINRGISELAAAIREVISGQDTEPDGNVDTAI